MLHVQPATAITYKNCVRASLQAIHTGTHAMLFTFAVCVCPRVQFLGPLLFKWKHILSPQCFIWQKCPKTNPKSRAKMK